MSTKFRKAPEKNSDLQNWIDSVIEEHRALEGSGYELWSVPQAKWAEAFESRETKATRCSCCGAYMHIDIHGWYDDSTCPTCGMAQDNYDGEDERGLTNYDYVSRARWAKLNRYHRSGGKKVLNQLQWDMMTARLASR
jgi:hypothetical protein